MRPWTILPGALLALALGATPACAGSPPAAVPVVPLPAEAHVASGTFTLTADSRIVADDDAGAQAVAGALAAILRPSTGFLLPIEGGQAGASDIALRLTPSTFLG